jgi:hypothetical protein
MLLRIIDEDGNIIDDGKDIERDKNGKLIEWTYAKEQTSQSMLKILGYK